MRCDLHLHTKHLTRQLVEVVLLMIPWLRAEFTLLCDANNHPAIEPYLGGLHWGRVVALPTTFLRLTPSLATPPKDIFYLLLFQAVTFQIIIIIILIMSMLFSHWVVSDSFAWTAALQAPWSREFSRQEYWSGWPLPSPGDLSDPGIKPTSPALSDGFFTTKLPAISIIRINQK